MNHSAYKRPLPKLPAFALRFIRRFCLVVGWLMAVAALFLLYFYASEATPSVAGDEGVKQGILSFGMGELLIGGFAAGLILFVAPWFARAARAKKLGRWPDELAEEDDQF